VDEAAELPFVDFADSSELNVGDTAIAIGAPLGLSGTVTNGIVSALNRSITVASSAVPEDSSGDETTPDGESPFDFWNFDVPGSEDETQTQATSTISLSVIQTDAAINPGNSGGALLDSDGNVIGINVAIASAGGSSAAGSIGVGFAVPSNLAKRVANEIIDDGAATHGLLGAGVSDVSLESQPDATTLGANIESITADGAAEAAGLRAGDIVTRFNDIPITSSTDLTAQVRSLAGGATAEVTYVRDGDASTADVTLGTLE
jgi:putative serine protease PepD